MLYVQSIISVPPWRKISQCDCAPWLIFKLQKFGLVHDEVFSRQPRIWKMSNGCNKLPGWCNCDKVSSHCFVGKGSALPGQQRWTRQLAVCSGHLCKCFAPSHGHCNSLTITPTKTFSFSWTNNTLRESRQLITSCFGTSVKAEKYRSPRPLRDHQSTFWKPSLKSVSTGD